MLPGISDGLNDLFERNHVRVEMVQAQQDGVSFAVESSPRLPDLLRSVDGSVRIVVEEDSAIISLAGDGIIAQESIVKRALSALLKDSGIRMVSQGGSQKSLSFAVPESKLTISAENLHREFFRAADHDIFAPTPESERRPFVAARVQDQSIHPELGWAVRPGILPGR
jgi:aspartokinase